MSSSWDAAKSDAREGTEHFKAAAQETGDAIGAKAGHQKDWAAGRADEVNRQSEGLLTQAKDATVDFFNKVTGHSQEAARKADATAQRTREGAEDELKQADAKTQDLVNTASAKSHHTKEAAKADGEALVEDAENAAIAAKDKVVEGTKYVVGRFTAPVSGDQETDRQTVDKAKSAAYGTKDDAHAAAEEARFKAERASGHASDKLHQAKDSIRDAGYQVKDSAMEAVDSAKERVHQLNQTIEDQITPDTLEEERASAGLIPSNTEDVLKGHDATAR